MVSLLSPNIVTCVILFAAELLDNATVVTLDQVLGSLLGIEEEAEYIPNDSWLTHFPDQHLTTTTTAAVRFAEDVIRHLT